MATQQQRRAESQRALLDASLDLLANGGLAHISVQQIGTMAGLSRGAVNFYYGTKDALMTAAAQDALNRWADLVDANAKPTAKTLAAAAEQFFANRRNPQIAAALLYEALGPSPQIRPTIQTAIDQLQSHIAACGPDGPARQPAATADALIGLATHSTLMTAEDVKATLQVILDQDPRTPT